MIQLEWLESDWCPTEAKFFGNKREMSTKGFDEQQATSYGYDNMKQLNEYNYNKDQECRIKYGAACKRNK